jgi:hypothetical protein
MRKLPSLARAGSVSAIHGGRGKKSPIKWTPRPLSVKQHMRHGSDGASAATQRLPSTLSVVTEGRPRAKSTVEDTREVAPVIGGGDGYDNVRVSNCFSDLAHFCALFTLVLHAIF